MSQPAYEPVMNLTRGDIVESIHFGAIAVVDNHNHLTAWWGNPDTITYLRSSAKPFQLMPFLESGGQEAFGLTLWEIAIMCASHSGTDLHKEVVQGIQAKTGVQETDLLCGVHGLSHKPTVEAMQQRGEQLTPNRHNCSGKHTGMVAFARLLGLPYGMSDHPYIDRNHPIQKQIVSTFADMCGLDPAQVHVGVDGCSAPNFAVPLRNAAYGLARLCDPQGLAEKRAAVCRTITTAMMANPDMVGGPDSFDTHLMQALEGKVVCKGGAEGYQAMGIMPGAIAPGSPALGVAFKVSDGDLGSHTPPSSGAHGHARPAVALEILRQLGVIHDDQLVRLARFGPGFNIENFRKILVGQGTTCFTLCRDK